MSTLGSIAVVGRNIAALGPAMALVFDGISLKDGSVITAGKLRVASAAVDWSSADQGAASDVSIASGDMSEMQWVTSFGGRSQLRCRRADGQTLRFVGMWDPEAYTQLAYFVKENYSLELKKAKLATKGWNWGSAVIEGRTMSFQVDGREAFDIPLEKVSQVQEAKHEVALEFHLDESEQKQNEEQLVEMRFFVPPTQPKSTENGDTNPELTPAQELLAKVRDRADITSLERDGFVQFKQINFVTPRCVTRKCNPLHFQGLVHVAVVLAAASMTWKCSTSFSRCVARATATKFLTRMCHACFCCHGLARLCCPSSFLSTTRYDRERLGTRT
eukprot:SAG25_NODE_710_length_5815_cov_9.003149_5_plen_331_part_00